MPSIDELEDNFFSCGETPLKFPPEVDLVKVLVCKSCMFRFSSPEKGPGVLLMPHDQQQGFKVDENPQTTITFNGVRHKYVDCFLTISGCHQLPNRGEPAVAELQIVFLSEKAPQTTRIVCLPIEIGTGTGNTYFSDLGRQSPSRAQTLASLLTKDDQWFMYVGSSFERRKKNTPRSDLLCKSNVYRTTYMVKTTPVFIRSEDFSRIKSQLPTFHQGPPNPYRPISLDRIYSFVTIIPSTDVEGPEVPKTIKKSTTVTAKQLKCRRIDPTKDITNGQIYIGGEKPGDTTLQQELDNAADLAKAWDETGTRIQPGDFENILGGILATVLALLCIGILAFFVLRFTYKDYVGTLRSLYDKTKNPVTEISGKTGSFFSRIGQKLHFCE